MRFRVITRKNFSSVAKELGLDEFQMFVFFGVVDEPICIELNTYRRRIARWRKSNQNNIASGWL